jgi:hypothetical protein
MQVSERPASCYDPLATSLILVVGEGKCEEVGAGGNDCTNQDPMPIARHVPGRVKKVRVLASGLQTPFHLIELRILKS